MQQNFSAVWYEELSLPAFFPLLSSQAQSLTPRTCIAETVAMRAACSHPCDCHIPQLGLLPHPFRPFLELKVPFILTSHSCHLSDTVSCYSGHKREGFSQELSAQVQKDNLRIFIPSCSHHNLGNALSSHPCYSCTRDRLSGVVLVGDAIVSMTGGFEEALFVRNRLGGCSEARDERGSILSFLQSPCFSDCTAYQSQIYTVILLKRNCFAKNQKDCLDSIFNDLSPLQLLNFQTSILYFTALQIA